MFAYLLGDGITDAINWGQIFGSSTCGGLLFYVLARYNPALTKDFKELTNAQRDTFDAALAAERASRDAERKDWNAASKLCWDEIKEFRKQLADLAQEVRNAKNHS